MDPTSLPPVIAIFGPTAAGKSAMALAVCERFHGEIVSADSRQVYRYMDIGTDKPSLADRARVPHHMIDIVGPDESYTLALYQEQAFRTVDDVLARGRLPVLAGGTPLYVNAIIEDWSIPRVEPDPVFRASLEAEASVGGPAPLYARLAELDPTAAEAILPTNTRRIIRALEVINRTGELMSAQQSKRTPPYNILPICLECDRAILYERIDRRVDSYVERGLVEEVASLHARGYGYDLPAMSGIGYRQIGDYLRGRATLGEAVQRSKWDTHAFVRHQGNWFQRSKQARRLDVTAGPAIDESLQLVESFLSFAQPPDGGV